jgi:hypothetical protein
MTLNINNKNLLFIKIISLISLCLTFIPLDKFSLPYSVLILLDLIDDLSDLRLSVDLFYNLICLIGFIMIFNKKTYIILIGYLLAPFSLFIHFYFHGLNSLFFFWFPFIVFIVTAGYVIYLELIKAKRI